MVSTITWAAIFWSRRHSAGQHHATALRIGKPGGTGHHAAAKEASARLNADSGWSNFRHSGMSET
jgi:hypothetical protein